MYKTRCFYLFEKVELRSEHDTVFHDHVHTAFSKPCTCRWPITLCVTKCQIIFAQVTRYQSDPGQATAYMIGQLDIIKSRKYAERELKDNFTLPDFHYQVKI